MTTCGVPSAPKATASATPIVTCSSAPVEAAPWTGTSGTRRARQASISGSASARATQPARSRGFSPSAGSSATGRSRVQIKASARVAKSEDVSGVSPFSTSLRNLCRMSPRSRPPWIVPVAPVSAGAPSASSERIRGGGASSAGTVVPSSRLGASQTMLRGCRAMAAASRANSSRAGRLRPRVRPQPSGPDGPRGRAPAAR